MDAYNGFGRPEASFPAYTSLNANDLIRIIKDGRSSLITYDNFGNEIINSVITDITPLIDSYAAANTVQVNSIDDLPAAVAGVRVLLPATRYVINNIINIGTDSLVMQSGTSIEGWAAQRCEITSAGPITIDTAAGAFNTCILRGPLRIRTTNPTGKAVNMSVGVFLIQEGVNIVGAGGTSVGVYCSPDGAAALFISRWTCSNVANALLVEGALGFGATISDYNSTTSVGNALNFNGISGVTNFSTIIIRGALSVSGGVGFRLVGTASSISVDTSSRFQSTADSGGYIQSTSGGRIGAMLLNGAGFIGGGTNKHGLDISNAFFNTFSYYIGQATTTAIGTSYGIFGQNSGLNPFNTRCIINGVSISGTAGALGGMTKADYKVEVTGCPGVENSATTGNLSINTSNPTVVLALPNVGQKVASATFAAAQINAGLERVGVLITTNDFDLIVQDPTAKTITVHYSAEFNQSSGAAQTTTFTLVRFRSGIPVDVFGSSARVTLQGSTTTEGVSRSVPLSVQENDQIYLTVASTAAQTLTFRSFCISIGN